MEILVEVATKRGFTQFPIVPTEQEVMVNLQNRIKQKKKKTTDR